MKNLKAEMARFGVSTSDIQNVLGCSTKTVLNKLNGTTEFTMSEGFKIHDAFFPSMELKYLFAGEPVLPPEAGIRDSA